MKSDGFSLIEILIVIGIIDILVVIAIIGFRLFQKESDLSNTTEAVIVALRLAQNKTLASERASQYGLYFDITTTPQRYILFKGASYATRDVSFDEIYRLSRFVEFYNINLSGGSEVVFNRLDGKAIPSGNLSVRLTDDPTKTKTIYVESSGLVGLTSPLVPAGGRLSDSRHVHFDLNWSIQNATTLKFDFPSIPQTEIVNMSSYFNIAKTEFDWQGTFIVGGANQEFRIHTHYLDAFDTHLCIHRDRNSGKNNQEVIIYIVDGGTDKEIGHYLADANDSVNVGAFGGVKEVQ